MDIDKIKKILNKKEYLKLLRELAKNLQLDETKKKETIIKIIIEKIKVESDFINILINTLNKITKIDNNIKNQFKNEFEIPLSINTAIDPLGIILKGNDVVIGDKLINIRDVNIMDEPRELDEIVVLPLRLEPQQLEEEEIIEPRELDEIIPLRLEPQQLEEEEIIEPREEEEEIDIIANLIENVNINNDKDYDEDDEKSVIENIKNNDEIVITNINEVQEVLDETTCSALDKFKGFDDEEKYIIKLFGLI
jgi:hypothetical protein